MSDPLPFDPLQPYPPASDDDDDDDFTTGEGDSQDGSERSTTPRSPALTLIIPPPSSEPDYEEAINIPTHVPSLRGVISAPPPPPLFPEEEEEVPPPQVTAPVRKAPPRSTPGLPAKPAKPIQQGPGKPVQRKSEPSSALRTPTIAAPVRTRDETKPRFPTRGAKRTQPGRDDNKPSDHKVQLQQSAESENSAAKSRAPASSREYFMRRSSTTSSMRKSSAVNQLSLERATIAPPVQLVVVLSSQDRLAVTELERAAGKLDFLPLVIAGERPEPNYRWTVKLADGEDGGFGPFLDATTKPAFTKREPLLPLAPAELDVAIVDVKSISNRSTRAGVPPPSILEFGDIEFAMEGLYDEAKMPGKIVLLGAPPDDLVMAHPRDRRVKVTARPVFELIDIEKLGWDGEYEEQGEGMALPVDEEEEEEPEG